MGGQEFESSRARHKINHLAECVRGFSEPGHPPDTASPPRLHLPPTAQNFRAVLPISNFGSVFFRRKCAYQKSLPLHQKALTGAIPTRPERPPPKQRKYKPQPIPKASEVDLGGPPAIATPREVAAILAVASSPWSAGATTIRARPSCGSPACGSVIPSPRSSNGLAHSSPSHEIAKPHDPLHPASATAVVSASPRCARSNTAARSPAAGQSQRGRPEKRDIRQRTRGTREA